MTALKEKLILNLIRQHFEPYDRHVEFDRGFDAYQAGKFRNPHAAGTISAQAWDHGWEAAKRFAIATG